MYEFSVTPSGMTVSSKTEKIALGFILKKILSNNQIVGFELIGKIETTNTLSMIEEILTNEVLYSRFIIQKMNFAGSLGITVPCHINVSLSALNDHDFVEVITRNYRDNIQIEINDICDYHPTIALINAMNIITMSGVKLWLDDFDLEKIKLLELTNWYGLKINAEVINVDNLTEIEKLSHKYKIVIFNYSDIKHKYLSQHLKLQYQFKKELNNITTILDKDSIILH